MYKLSVYTLLAASTMLASCADLQRPRSSKFTNIPLDASIQKAKSLEIFIGKWKCVEVNYDKEISRLLPANLGKLAELRFYPFTDFEKPLKYDLTIAPANFYVVDTNGVLKFHPGMRPVVVGPDSIKTGPQFWSNEFLYKIYTNKTGLYLYLLQDNPFLEIKLRKESDDPGTPPEASDFTYVPIDRNWEYYYKIIKRKSQP